MPSSGKRILIVEDHNSIRMLLGTLLGKNYQVVTKQDGLEGMAWLSQGNIPDLILLDMEMPRLNGETFLKNIRNSGFFKDIPVIVISGNEDKSGIDYCYRLGVADYLTKPFNPLVLKDKISRVLANSERLVS
jgi:two-component system, chemotaxis family, chemotaxis protein CheY